jgi:hypothetical protein
MRCEQGVERETGIAIEPALDDENVASRVGGDARAVQF